MLPEGKAFRCSTVKVCLPATDEQDMHGRVEGRFAADFNVIITDLEHSPSADALASQELPGRVSDISESGMCVLLPVELAPGRVLKLEIAGSSLFGYVVYSNADGADFRTGIEITRVLFGESDLSKLLRAVLAEEIPGMASSFPQ
jgi:hypothetical protein